MRTKIWTEETRQRAEYVSPGVFSRYKMPDLSIESTRLCFEDNFRDRHPITITGAAKRITAATYKDVFVEKGICHTIPSLFTTTGELNEHVFDELYEEAHSQLKANDGYQKKPGYPWCFTFENNGEVFKHCPDKVRDCVRGRLIKIYSVKDWEQYRNYPGLWLHHDLHDPTLTFKKNEPEPMRKQFGRIVNGESIVDQMINRILFYAFLEAEVQAYPHCPNVKGIGFNEFHAETIVGRFEHYSGKFKYCCKSDVSGWEKGFSLSCAEVFEEVFVQTCSNWDESFRVFLNWWKFSLVGGLYADRGGLIYALDREQGMRSGNLCTTSANGCARFACAIDAGSGFAITNGDDCVEWSDIEPSIVSQKYLENNVMVRGFETITIEECPEFTFCSHKWLRDQEGRGVCYLDELDKSFFKIFSKKHPTYSDIENLSAEMLHHPDTNLCKRFLKTALPIAVQ